MNCSNDACVTAAAELEKLKAALAAKQECICSYCGHVSRREGRQEQEFQIEITDHILVCDKRPERAMAAALWAVVGPLGVDLDSIPKGDIPALVAAVERRWNEEIDLRQKQIDVLLEALGHVDQRLSALFPAA